MIQDVLSQTPLVAFPLLAMAVFVTFFVGMVLWIFRRGTRELYDEVGRLPVAEGASAASAHVRPAVGGER